MTIKSIHSYPEVEGLAYDTSATGFNTVLTPASHIKAWKMRRCE